MTTRRESPYGTWESPISAADVAAGARGFEQVALDGDAIWWIETRPEEKGRSVVMRWRPGAGVEEITPRGFSARTLVNSYGGGAMTVGEGRVVFSNFSPADFPGTRDQRLHLQAPGMQPRPITPQVNTRYADGVLDPRRNLLFCVREESDALLHGQAQQTLVAVDLDGGKLPVTLAEGADFYACPRLSPDGRQLAWIEWDYPSMPWEGTRLCVADLRPDGTARNARKLAGDPAEHIAPSLNPVLQEALRVSGESLTEPRWAPDGTLYCVTDRLEVDGERWWNLHRVTDEGLTPVTKEAAEFTAPLWRLGASSWDVLSDTEALCAVTRQGTWSLARVDLSTGALTPLDLPWTQIGHVHTGEGFAVFTAGSFTEPTALIRLDLATMRHEVIRASGEPTAEAKACFAAPERIEVPTGDGSETTHAFYHPPLNPGFTAPEGDRPPLLIVIHGGPTAAVSASVKLDIRYFTSRGFGVVDVNYRGSTGFGRAYRQRMYGGWGVVDIEDCVAVARHLADADKVDPYRIASRGGSSGGYTTLALAAFTDLLSAAASYYGISNLEMIATDTDKLEARYAELLLGPWPRAQKLFKARSPLFHAGDIDCPLILFQGLDDPVVPPPQARVLIDALMEKKLPVAANFYEGESHGFRMKANIIRSLEQELSFYGTMMGFTPAGRLDTPEIHNWPSGEG